MKQQFDFKSQKLREMLVLLVSTISFWGIFYPNFTLTDDVCHVYYESSEYADDDAQEEAFENLSEEEQTEILQKMKQENITVSDLREGRVRVKSRILEYIRKWWK